MYPEFGAERRDCLRIIYDDKMQREFVSLVEECLDSFTPEWCNSVSEYSSGMTRVRPYKVRTILETYCPLFEFGNNTRSAYGIGNNSERPVYFRDASGELQHCANLHMNMSPFGELYVYVTDYNDNRVSHQYTIYSSRIKKEG